MKLLMLTVDWWPIEGGIASLCEGVARALARRGHQVEVLAPRVRASAPASPAPAAQGVTVRRWPGYALGPARWLPFMASALPRLAGHDLVLAMNPAYGGLAAALGERLGGPPFLAWAYGYELLKARSTPLAPVYRWLFGRSQAAIAISRNTRALLRDLGVAPGHVAVIEPGVDPPAMASDGDAEVGRRLGIPTGPVVLTVARLIERKGHALLLEAMAPVLRLRPDVTWIVAGRGPLADPLQQRAAALGIAGQVRLTGYVTAVELAALYRRATLFALLPQASAADVEGYGIVFLEAGAHGLPVVAGRSGGVVDAVEDGESGLLVDPARADEATAAIRTLLDDGALRLRLGAGGRARARTRSWDRVAAEVERLGAAGAAR